MLRDGDHNDVTLKSGITSATSIRETLKTGNKKKVKKNIPKFVYEDLTEYPFAFDKLITSSVIRANTEDLAKIQDCTEGLENRIKALSKDNHTVTELVEKVSTKRYPASRVRRILTANLLGINKDLVLDCLKQKTYAKILAVNKDCKDLISQLCQTSQVPVLTRKSDVMLLKKTALKAFEIDVLANDLYSLATEKKTNEHQMLFV
jgi:predicted nucleotidyltransferase